jgi:LysR family glycine cleavage system transcriptional activator
MARRLPPLNALRAFETAGRLLSLSKAADELAVTPAAISHQVKALEDLLQVKLFRRLSRAVVLTDAGQALLPRLSEGFDRLAAAVEQMRARDRRGILTVSVAPSFTAKWLVPRLYRFQARLPDIDVRISSAIRLVDFARDDVDMAIRYGRGRYPGLRSERLLGNDIFPVCSPKLRKGPHPLRRPEDLRHHTLLHDEIPGDDLTPPRWEVWLSAAGVSGVDPTRGLRLDGSNLVIDAAIAGQGVALGKSTLAADDLAAGRLMRPFAFNISDRYAYYVVCPEGAAATPKIAAFRDWLFDEARAFLKEGKGAR